uniref:BPTI/Kunitz inhibitor domain-containing protein n=1 Tax=Pundamilia nyererei TaxID=303518 RepID=A0A3B4GB53_9CICH
FLFSSLFIGSSILLFCICFLGKDAGDCVNYTVRWFFDHKRSVCSRFWYSGCGGNENRFATQAECLPADIGNQCKKYATAWFFDTNVGACSRFWYGGCGGNANRFRTEYECFQTCGNQHSCILPQDRGSCDNYTMMWFFDAAQKECARFWYGGCGGNKNRFLTLNNTFDVALWSPQRRLDRCTQSSQVSLSLLQAVKHRFIHGFIFTHTDSAGLWSSDSVRCF